MSRIRSPIGRDMVVVTPVAIAAVLLLLINADQRSLTFAVLFLVLGGVVTLPVLLAVLAVPFFFLNRRFGGGWRWALSWAMVLPIAVGLEPSVGRTKPYLTLLSHYERYSADIAAAHGKAVVWDWGGAAGLAPPEQFLIYDPSDRISQPGADIYLEPAYPTLDYCRGSTSRLIGHFYRCN